MIQNINYNSLLISLKINEIKNDISQFNNSLGKMGRNETNISSNLGKIDNINKFLISGENFKKTFDIGNQVFKFIKNKHFYILLELEIEHDFTIDSSLIIKDNPYYNYNNLDNDYHRLQHQYNIYNNDNLINTFMFNKEDFYDKDLDNTLFMNKNFCVHLKDNYKSIKIVYYSIVSTD